MSKILVTGGAGFIGSHLVDALLSKGETVVVFDNLSSGHKENLQQHEKLSVVKGDILDPVSLRKAGEGCTEIFHLAEYLPDTKKYGPGHVVKFSFEAPLQDFEVSVRGTLNVLDMARQLDAKVFFTSTAAIYGTPEKVPIKEEDRADPVSPYGMSKFVAEQYCRMFSKLYGLNTAVARIFNTYGPRQRKYVAYDLIKKLRENPSKLELLGSGKEARDFVYVKDTVAALLLIHKKESRGQPYNIGNGKPVTIEELARLICGILEINPKIEFKGSSWKGDITTFYADNSRLKSLGFEPATPLKEGLKNLVDWEKSITS